MPLHAFVPTTKQNMRRLALQDELFSWLGSLPKVHSWPAEHSMDHLDLDLICVFSVFAPKVFAGRGVCFLGHF